jgi:hypothetical protein
MKKTIFAMTLITLSLVISCGGKGGGSKYKAPITVIEGETVYDAKTKEPSTVSGDITLYKTKIGTVENGILTFDLSQVQIPDKNLEQDEYLYTPKIKVTPQEARWDRYRNLPLEIDTGEMEEPESMFPPITKEKWETVGDTSSKLRPVLYQLSFTETPGDTVIEFVYFAQNTTIKGKDNFAGVMEITVDIKAKKGWNLISIQKTKTSLTVTTQKGAPDIKWYATRRKNFS